jgi:hypothetical protein
MRIKQNRKDLYKETRNKKNNNNNINLLIVLNEQVTQLSVVS